MEVKRDILWRVYISFIAVALAGFLILGKAFYIQQVQGKYWRSMSDSLHQKIEETDAERGTIYSSDGQMLSTSIPQFDVYVDFEAEGLREKNGRRFRENIDSLSYSLSALFKDRSEGDWRALLSEGYQRHDRWFLLRRKISFADYNEIRRFPLVREGKNKSGFVFDARSVRLNPYQMLAFRTIGLDRDSFKVGLEMTYDSVLRGLNGKRLVRYVAGISVPVDAPQVESVDGKDIVTTLDVRIQDIAENALMKMMVSNEAEHGCAIVMEVKTGKVLAMANLGKGADGGYRENYNYALTPTEPGSTFKLVTMLAALEDKKVTLDSKVNLQQGVWDIYGRTIHDAEQHGLNEVTIKHAFEVSSNVGMAKLAVANYSAQPSQFIHHIQALGLDRPTHIDLTGETSPTIYRPGSRNWSATTLPWMAFGYNLLVTPLHTAMLYNAVANKGRMMKPYLVGEVRQDGKLVREIQPQVVNEKICSDVTLAQLRACLLGVTTVEGGTAYKLFKGCPYPVAGKTGTALVANGSRGYADHVYQSALAGYFPANDPQYTIVVVIKNKPFAPRYVGAAVAGPVFKEISDRLYTMTVKRSAPVYYATSDSGKLQGPDYLMRQLGVNVRASTQLPVSAADVPRGTTALMPSLDGLNLRDALFACESRGIRVAPRGQGKVTAQSVLPGEVIRKGSLIQIELN